MSYLRFGAMIVTSTLVMFGMIYLNTLALDHALFSQTRMWMALLMGAAMANLMLPAMYSHCSANIAGLAGSVVAFAASPTSSSSLRCERSRDCKGSSPRRSVSPPAPPRSICHRANAQQPREA